jgi:hypothetical protein
MAIYEVSNGLIMPIVSYLKSIDTFKTLSLSIVALDEPAQPDQLTKRLRCIQLTIPRGTRPKAVASTLASDTLPTLPSAAPPSTMEECRQ